jgi:hypothetical protein
MKMFEPAVCPRSGCPSKQGSPFTYRHRGVFRRGCDGRTVRRFVCLTCQRGFSEQTFRLDYRLKRPELLERFFIDRVSKVTHRQSARNHCCSRTTEERHFRRLGAHCAAFHHARLEELAASASKATTFLFDELETYEEHRTQKPVTVPVLIERESGFVIDAQVGALAPRSKLAPKRAPASPPRVPRRSESQHVVRAVFEQLRSLTRKQPALCVLTDKKPSYVRILRELFRAPDACRCVHRRTPSTRMRDTRNPLWPINHTLARLRDNLSRLVRETWAAAKQRRWLAAHLAIWICYRNYVRGQTNRLHRITPAMALGLQRRPWSPRKLLAWKPLSANASAQS